MNQIFAGGIGLIIALWLWSKGKKPQFHDASQQSFINNHPKTATSLVQAFKSQDKLDPLNYEKIIWSKPKNSRDKILLRKKLMKLIESGPEERLKAVSIASEWGHSLTLPILKRGLKDSDMRVIIVAAQAIERYKCFSKKTQTSFRRPRNVFLMR